MSNLSYCRFENTVNDLYDCKEALDEKGVYGVEEDASEYDAPYVKQLIELCREIADQYGE